MSYFIKKPILNGVIIQTHFSSKFLEDTAANHSKCIVKHTSKKYKEKKISLFLPAFLPPCLPAFLPHFPFLANWREKCAHTITVIFVIEYVCYYGLLSVASSHVQAFDSAFCHMMYNFKTLQLCLNYVCHNKKSSFLFVGNFKLMIISIWPALKFPQM